MNPDIPQSVPGMSITGSLFGQCNPGASKCSIQSSVAQVGLESIVTSTATPFQGLSPGNIFGGTSSSGSLFSGGPSPKPFAGTAASAVFGGKSIPAEQSSPADQSTSRASILGGTSASSVGFHSGVQGSNIFGTIDSQQAPSQSASSLQTSTTSTTVPVSPPGAAIGPTSPQVFKMEQAAGQGSLFSGKSVSSSGGLFGRKSMTTAASGDQQRPHTDGLFSGPSTGLFGKRTQEKRESFGKSEKAASPIGSSGETVTKTVLFGKTVKDTGEEEYYRAAESHQPKTGLFGKKGGESGQTEKGADLFRKPAGGLFGKPTGLFGKASENVPEIKRTVLFGKSSSISEEGGDPGVDQGEKVFDRHRERDWETRRSENSGVFGKLSRGFKEDERREHRIERAPLSQRQPARQDRGLFGKRDPDEGQDVSERQTRHLFGKGPSKETGEDENGGRRARPVFSGGIKPGRMSDAARRSVKKSINIARSKSKDDDLGSKTAIICQEVPNEYNNRAFLVRHFSKFGQIKRVYPNPAKQKATIHFQSHDQAATAKRKGRIFRVGRPSVSILLSSHSTSGQDEKPQRKAPVPGLFGKPRTLFSSGVNNELEALQGTSDRDIAEEVHLLQRLEEYGHDGDVDRVHAIQTVTGHRSPVKARPDVGFPSNIRMLPQESRSSPVRGARHEALSARSSGTSGMVAYNATDRINILEERERQMRLGIQKVSRLEKAQAVIGTCPDMCPEKERYMREDRRRLSVFEMVPGTNIKGQNPKIDHSKAVKEYSRSSADQDEPLPHEMRPPHVLAKTMDYLVNNIMDLGNNNWGEWFDFLWNRTRGIRKDITQQHLCDLTAVALVEKCVRFHIYCAERLVEEDMMVFDTKINNENLTKCLQTLKELYYDLENKQGIRCPNEAEFRGYMILMNLNEGDTLREVQQLPDEIRTSPAVKFAVETYHALDSNNYIRFFKLVKKVTFLQACIMHRYFNQVRHKALRIMLKALHKRTQYPVEDLVRQLAFEESEDAAYFCEEHGLDAQDGVVMLNKSDYITPEAIGTFRRAETVIESKLQVSVGEVVNGGPLPPNDIINPSSSFSDHGRYIGDLSVTGGRDPTVTCYPVEVEVSRDITPERTTVVSDSAARKLPNEVIKELARDLFLEVIDELALQTSNDTILEFEIATAGKVVADETCDEFTRDLCEQMIIEARNEQEELEIRKKLLEEKRQKKEEKERQELERKAEESRHAALIVEICQHAVRDVEWAVLEEETLRTAQLEYRVVQAQLHEESKQRVAVVVQDEITEDACKSLAAEVAKEVIDLEIRKQELEDVKYTVQLFRVNNFFKIWRKRYVKQVRLKTAMHNFPSAPSRYSVKEQVTCLLPWRPSDEIARDAFYVGKKARLSIEPPRSISLRQQVNMNHIDLRNLLQGLRHHRAWKPFDLPNLVGEKLIGLLGGRSKKELMTSEPSLYWKVLVVQPACQKNSVLCDWVKHKLQRGAAGKARNYRKARTDGIDVLSLYSSMLVAPSIPAQATLHVCVSGTTERHLENKDVIMGSSVVIGFILPSQTEAEKVRSVKDLAKCCPSTPLLVITDGKIMPAERDALMEVAQDRLHLMSIEDVETLEATKSLGQGLQWAAESCPSHPKLTKKPLRNFIDEFLFKEFYTPVYQNLAARKNRGLPHQSPNVLIGLYQSAVNHLSAVGGSLELAKISWPALEFSCTNPDLPAQDWNAKDQLDYLESLLLSISLPSFIYHDNEAESWNQACKDVWAYIKALTVDESDITNLLSRVGWAIRRSREDFEDTCYLAERLEDCEPRFINMPWTEIISACISYRLANLDWVDGLAESDEDQLEAMVYYTPSSLGDYRLPTFWTETLLETLETGMTTTKDCVVRAAKRKLDETANESEMKRTALDSSASPDTSVILDLSVANKVTLEADNSAYELKSRLSIEKQNLDVFEKYLQSVLEEDDESLDMDTTWSRTYKDVGNVSIERGFEVHQSASDSILMLQQDVLSNKRADMNFEMRLRSLLMNQ
ncbi:germinal-center associated nuclear protein-like [Lineus longissimus]|uniref:germinal-center associated nuclear protein-like n=1 Tax=Lineus longissimus TaxID=88925 RepID=UPI00315CBC4A